jgi:hypothetical protein
MRIWLVLNSIYYSFKFMIILKLIHKIIKFKNCNIIFSSKKIIHAENQITHTFNSYHTVTILKFSHSLTILVHLHCCCL